MITGIRFLNFQGFSGDQRVPLGEITAIFGPNSSGKSSVSRGLRILSESFRAYRKGGFVKPIWQLDGGATPNSLTFGKEPLAVLESGIGVKVPFAKGIYSEAWFSLVSSADGLNQTNEIELTYPDCEPGKELSLHLQGDFDEIPSVLFRDDDATSLGVMFMGMQDPIRILLELDLDIYMSPKGLIRNHHPELFEALVAELGEEFFEALNQYHAERQLDDFDDYLEPSDSTVDQLSKFRPRFQKFFSGMVGLDGSFLVLQDQSDEHKARKSLEQLFLEQLFFDVIREVRSALLESHFSTPIRSVPKVPVPALNTAAMEAVNSKLAAITSGRYSLEIVDQSVEDLYRIEYLLRDHFTGILSSFTNVGQGLTQVLDVLFSLESQASLVSLEQPDLHLHPLAVGALTSLIVEDIAVRLGERQVLIETHSETILTRLQKEKRLSSEHPGLGASDFDLRILYCEPVQGELVDDELVQFVAGIHAPDYLLDKLNTLVEDLADQRDQPLDMALLRKDPFIWDKLRDQEDFWEKLSPYMGFNSIEELRLDHLGDVLDPFPISFSDLRIQDLLQ